MADPTGGVKLNLDDILGPFVIGSMVGALLCGCLLVQASEFFTRFPHDRLYYKITVAGVTFISVLSWTIQCYDMWWLCITSRPTELNLLAVPIIIYMPIALSTISQFLSQSHFAFRSYQLCERNKWIGLGLTILVLSSFGLTFAAAVVVFVHPRYVFNGSLVPYLHGTVPGISHAFLLVSRMHEADMIVSAIVDVAITTALAIRITRISRQRQGSRPSTDRLLTRVIAFSISTAAVSSVFELTTAVILFCSIEHHNYTYFFAEQLPHLYGLVCIWSLNLRTVLNPNSSNNDVAWRGKPSASHLASGQDSKRFPNQRLPFETRTEGDGARAHGGMTTDLNAKADPFPLSFATVTHSFENETGALGDPVYPTSTAFEHDSFGAGHQKMPPYPSYDQASIPDSGLLPPSRASIRDNTRLAHRSSAFHKLPNESG